MFFNFWQDLASSAQPYPFSTADISSIATDGATLCAWPISFL